MRFRIAPQIVRLLLLAGGIVLTYCIARAFLTPPSFGQYGHYRGAALEEIASRELSFAGAKACNECHADEAEKLAKFQHQTISCESCHGPARAHASNPDIDLPKTTDATCVRCHAVSPARPKWLKQIQPGVHYGGDHCVECHIPHQPKESP
jgi:hypothetical protein